MTLLRMFKRAERKIKKRVDIAYNAKNRRKRI